MTMNSLMQFLAMLQQQPGGQTNPPGRRTGPKVWGNDPVLDESMFSQGDIANASPYLRKMLDAADKGDPVARTFVAQVWTKIKMARYNEANPERPIANGSAGTGLPLPNGEFWRLK
jgi:hypothetical protein